jgi:hypothetical protein
VNGTKGATKIDFVVIDTLLQIWRFYGEQIP